MQALCPPRWLGPTVVVVCRACPRLLHLLSHSAPVADPAEALPTLLRLHAPAVVVVAAPVAASVAPWVLLQPVLAVVRLMEAAAVVRKS